MLLSLLPADAAATSRRLKSGRRASTIRCIQEAPLPPVMQTFVLKLQTVAITTEVTPADIPFRYCAH